MEGALDDFTSGVVEHLDAKSATDSVPSLEDTTVISETWRPHGRSNNLRGKKRAVLDVVKSRQPLSPGDVEGALHRSVSLLKDQFQDLRGRGADKIENPGGCISRTG